MYCHIIDIVKFDSEYTTVYVTINLDLMECSDELEDKDGPLHKENEDMVCKEVSEIST